jgi:hypothetical protein
MSAITTKTGLISGWGKDTPSGRVAAAMPPRTNKIISLPRLGGLHHRYAVAA